MSNEVKSVCPICGKKFTKKAVNQKYCSIKCKRAAAMKAGVEFAKSIVKSANVPVGSKHKPTKNCGKKAVVKKIVKGKAVEKINLPKPPAVKEVKPEVVKVVCKHTINPGDIVTFEGFTPKMLVMFVSRIAAIAAFHMDKFGKKPAKKGK